VTCVRDARPAAVFKWYEYENSEGSTVRCTIQDGRMFRATLYYWKPRPDRGNFWHLVEVYSDGVRHLGQNIPERHLGELNDIVDHVLDGETDDADNA